MTVSARNAVQIRYELWEIAPKPFKAYDPKNVAVEPRNLTPLTKGDEDEDEDEVAVVAVVVIVVSFVLHSITRSHAHCPTINTMTTIQHYLGRN